MASRCLVRLRSAVSIEDQVADSESRAHLVVLLLPAGAVLWVADPGHLIPMRLGRAMRQWCWCCPSVSVLAPAFRLHSRDSDHPHTFSTALRGPPNFGQKRTLWRKWNARIEASAIRSVENFRMDSSFEGSIIPQIPTIHGKTCATLLVQCSSQRPPQEDGMFAASAWQLPTIGRDAHRMGGSGQK
jgi:hypothetical protein